MEKMVSFCDFLDEILRFMRFNQRAVSFHVVSEVAQPQLHFGSFFIPIVRRMTSSAR
jgi:hypothetical protein